jgi:Cu/Zn superoxide dismutase
MLSAEAIFEGPGSGFHNITGSVSFTQNRKNYVRVDIKLKNVPKGLHGIHIHEKKINFQKNEDYYSQAKEHFNGSLKLWSPECQNGTPHGSLLYNTDRHIGDLCNNIYSFGKDIEVVFTYYDKLISLVPEHPHCIIGKSIIINENEDDQGCRIFFLDINSTIKSKITGNSGKHIACANIYRI